MRVTPGERSPGWPCMALEFASFLALALALGFKHSYDADHIVAVSNLLARSTTVRRATTMSVSWAAGHMLTASVITVTLFLAGSVLLVPYLSHFELAVAVMLLMIGSLGLAWEFGLLQRVRPFLRRLGVVHEHPHEHSSKVHRHTHVHLGRYKDHGAMFGIGIVHGLASNDELLVLLLAALGVATVPGLLLGLGVFTFGVVVGMIVFGVALSYPKLRWGDAKVLRAVNIAAAVLSIVYGLLLLAGFEGINLLPVG